jgi:uncharacterized membrane protein YoaK (UPF0700 family)
MTDDTEPVTPYAGPLVLVVALASVAGFLDAVSLARITHTFVAFQTGNLVLVGLDVGRGHWSDAVPPALAIVAFLAGSALVPTVVRGAAGVRRVIVVRLLGTTIALLLVEAVLVAIVCGVGTGDAPGRVLRSVCTVLSGVAMAFQTPVVRTVDGVPVSSTFSTGMLTRLGQAFGALPDASSRPRESAVARVLGATVLAFLVGAVVGGALLEPLGNATIFVPVVALVVIATATVRAAND